MSERPDPLSADAQRAEQSALPLAEPPPTAETRTALAALTRLSEPGDATLAELVKAHGAVAVLQAVRDDALPTPRLPHYRARLDGLDPDRDLARATALGARLVCPGDDEWPDQLADLHDRRPLALWVRGDADLRRAARRSVAVVGARAATSYGAHVAAEIAAVLAERGWTVVSGAAYGIDAAAHRGALAVDGSTAAVLACGIDVAYPRGNHALIARIAQEGLVVSELPPGCSPTRVRFLNRNRVIAALTRGTVVVEAALRSGALNTAGEAHLIGRQVMAVPGPITSALSAGCHQAVRNARAQLVTDAAEVIDLVGELGLDAATEPRGPVDVRDELDPVSRLVLEAVPVARATGPARIARVAGVEPGRVLRCLAVLHSAGLVEASPQGWRLSRAARAERAHATAAGDALPGG